MCFVIAESSSPTDDSQARLLTIFYLNSTLPNVNGVVRRALGTPSQEASGLRIAAIEGLPNRVVDLAADNQSSSAVRGAGQSCQPHPVPLGLRLLVADDKP